MGQDPNYCEHGNYVGRNDPVFVCPECHLKALAADEKAKEIAADVLAILAAGGPAPEPHPMQWLADLGFRHLVVVSTLDTRTALAAFDVLGKIGEAEAEMDRLAATGKFTDRFGVALAVEARK